jgi:predicted HicB family RNase H-like nuclease
MQIRVRDLPPALHRDLKVWAAQEDTTLNELVIEILRAAVEKRAGKK